MTSLKSNFPCEIFKQFSLFEKEDELQSPESPEKWLILNS